MTNTEKYILIYNELTDYLKQFSDNPDAINGLVKAMSATQNKLPVIRYYFDELKTCAEIRNIMEHKSLKGIRPLVEPSEALLKKFSDISEIITNPNPALHDGVAVVENNIFKVTLEDKILDICKEMANKTYTHVPVIREGKLIGVFSENVLLSYIASENELLVENSMKMKDLEKFVLLENHKSEYFEFVPRTATYFDLKELFYKNIVDSRRLAVAYITHNGKKDEKILGMVTAWDMPKGEKKYGKI